MSEIPEQQQPYPGRAGEMRPGPKDEMRDYHGSGLLTGRRTLVTGGDSGIGRAVAVAFAKEGADVAIAYLSEDDEINRLRGNRSLIDYAATKGAVSAFTYSMAQALNDRGIRVNCVAPGPVWTPLIPATLPPDKVEGFGGQSPAGRAADPDEIAPSYVFFASDRLSSFYTGEVLAPTGGEIQKG